MSNAIFAYENLAAANGVFVGVNTPVSAHPASMLTDETISQRCWFDGSAGAIYVYTGDPWVYGLRGWSMVALLGTNIPDDLIVTLEATDDETWSTVEYGPVEIPPSPAGNQNNRWLLLDSDRHEQRLRISVGDSAIVIDAEDTVLPGGMSGSEVINDVKIGQLLLSSPLRLTRNFSQNYAVGAQVGVIGQRTQYGVARFYQTHGMVETWQIPFAHYPRDCREKLLVLWQAVEGSCRPLLFIPDPDDGDRLAVWCRAAESLSTQFDYWQLHDMGSLTLSITEEAMPEEIEETSA